MKKEEGVGKVRFGGSEVKENLSFLRDKSDTFLLGGGMKKNFYQGDPPKRKMSSKMPLSPKPATRTEKQRQNKVHTGLPIIKGDDLMKKGFKVAISALYELF